MIPKRLLVGTTAFLLWSVAAAAQPAPPDRGVVTGVGTVVLKRRPDLMRISVDVFAQGKSMKEALANLKDRREAARGQLTTLGAAKDSIAFGEPQVNTSLLEARQQMEMMIRSRMGNRAKKDAAKPQAVPTVVSATLKAEWPLKGRDTESLLIEIAQLQEAIKAVDLAGRKDLEKLSTEDEELREEMEGVEANNNNDPGRTQPGTPAFALLSKVSEEDLARALADAFRKARSRAETTAKAAGEGLGPLRHLESSMQSGPPADGNEVDPRVAYRMAATGSVMPPEGAEVDPEAKGTQPGAVEFHVTVTAAFALNAGH